MPHTCPSYPCPLPPALAFSCPLLQNIVWQEMDSKALKRAYGMQPHQKGVLVRGAGQLACGEAAAAAAACCWPLDRNP